MQETITKIPITQVPSTGKLLFSHLPGYAAFLKKEFLFPYIKEQIQIAREINLPMLKFFVGMTDEQLIEMAADSHKEFLTACEENNLEEYLTKSLRNWIADDLGIIKREEVSAEDITLGSYMRKKALVKFIPSYTHDVNEVIEIINEIDIFTVKGDTAATNVYIQLLKDTVHEQTKFNEVLSNTTPGIHLIFRLSDLKLIYTNKNTRKFFGATADQMLASDFSIVENKVFPADIPATINGIEQCKIGKDNEVISWEMRVLASTGKYVWTRNYASVFKRNEQGTPLEIVVVGFDTDKEKHIENKLMYREQQLLEAQAQAHLGSFELDIKTGEMEGTPELKKIFEVETLDVYILRSNIHALDQWRVNETREKAINDNTIYDIEYRYIINGKEKILWTRGRITFRDGHKILVGTVMDVTGRHAIIKQLLESRDLYKQAQRLSHIGNWKWNLTTNECICSEELFRIYEMQPTDGPVDLKEITTYLHPDDVPIVQENVRRLRELRTSSDYIYRIVLKNGNIKHLYIKADSYVDEDGGAVSLFGTIQDVTEKQLLIEKLQTSESLFKQAQALSHIGNWSWDMETKKLEWSDELYKIYDMPLPGSGSNADDKDIYNHPETESLITEFIKHSLETLEPFEFTFKVASAGNKVKFLNAKGEIKLHPGGAPYKIYGTIQDITEQKLVEKQLKDYQQFITKITDVSPSIIATHNIHTGKFSFINQAVEKLLGYPARQFMDEGVAFLSSLIHPDDITAITEKRMNAIEDANKLPKGSPEPVIEFKYRILHKNGHYLCMHTYATIFDRNERGLVESLLNVSVDTTEHEKAQQQLHLKNVQLQQSNASLEEYAYVASHDLKEPLRKISTFTDRLATTQQEFLTDESKSYLARIIAAADRMQKIINDLLSVSTILGNNAYELSDLNMLFNEALQPLDFKIEETGTIVKASKLPSLAVVPSQFRQLFQNLVGNSLKFMRAGVKPKITIKHKFIDHSKVGNIEGANLAKAKTYLKLEIEDNGIGFDNVYASKIFYIFHRLHGRSEYEGTGIGLALCKKIVENHGGAIFAKGTPDQGAIFTIILPVIQNT